MDVSVVIPIYNGEKTLNECINSVLNQDYKNYEVILVDNNSTDKTKEIIKRFEKKNKRIKYFFESYKGTGSARNRGEINSKGDIILMTDSDCIIPKDWISKIVKEFSNKETKAVQGRIISQCKSYWADNIDNEKYRIAKERLKDKKVGILDTANFAIRKKLLKKIGYTSKVIKYSNDLELEARLKLNGYELKLKEILVYHKHKNNFLDIFNKWVCRGKDYAQVLDLYKDQRDIFAPEGYISDAKFILGITRDLLTLRKSFLYNLTTGIAWRVGKIKYYVKNSGLKPQSVF